METTTTSGAPPPLHSIRPLRRRHANRLFAAVYAVAILSLLYHHILSLLHPTSLSSFLISLLLFISDTILAYMWSKTQAFRMNPVHRQVFPENLKLDRKDFPAMDIFICTADPYKEPPIDVVNTALSVMAYDYPAEKLSVYVSDDGGSELTMFAFMEAAKFGKLWLPFCRENNITERSPDAYFSSSYALTAKSLEIKDESSRSSRSSSRNRQAAGCGAAAARPGGRAAPNEFSAGEPECPIARRNPAEGSRKRAPADNSRGLQHGYNPPVVPLTAEALQAIINEATAKAITQFITAQGAMNAPLAPQIPQTAMENVGESNRGGDGSPAGRNQAAANLPKFWDPQRRSPLSTEILAVSIPHGLKLTNWETFDGTGNPQEHLDKFCAKAGLYDLSEAALCKVFRTTFSKRALTWFSHLPAFSINSFEEFSQKFLDQFSINKRYAKTPSYLFSIAQRENENLRTYMQRFVEAAHEVPHVNHELLAGIVQQNLKHGRFKESIAGRPPTTLEELLNRAEKYIRIEETTSSTTGQKQKDREDSRRDPPRTEQENDAQRKTESYHAN